MRNQVRDRDLPIWIMEPEAAEKRRSAARTLFEGKHKAPLIQETVSIGDIKKRLKDIRGYVRDNISSLVAEFKTNLSQKYPGVKLKSASDSIEAIRYITEVSNGTRIISVNNSCIVAQELKPGLISNGFTVINSYRNEYELEERKIHDYWDLPRLLDKNLAASISISEKISGIDLPAESVDTKDYLSVLGVNAVSANDSTVFFLQHFSNIRKDLREAKKVVLVVGLDKIVKNRDDAAFLTRCMGIFGMESVLLGMQPKPDKTPTIDELSLPSSNADRELHLLILDNGRTDLLQGKFRDLLLCLDCRACNQHCPIRFSFDVDYIWTPKTYLSQFLYGRSNTIDVCLHCEACRIQCPVDIDLPNLMWQAKIDYMNKHGRSLRNKLLGAPELLAKLGTFFAPLSNRLMGSKLVKIPMELVIGIDRKANLPAFHSQTFRKWFRKNA
jgi:L-lactate utilization protein LutB